MNQNLPLGALPTPGILALESVKTLKLSECPGLQRLRRGLSKHLTRIYPTRRVALTPPAMAAITTLSDIGLPLQTEGHDPRKAITVFLPTDYEPHLAGLIAQTPQVRVHHDLDLAHSAAYLSWTCPLGTPPATLWLEPDRLIEALGTDSGAVQGSEQGQGDGDEGSNGAAHAIHLVFVAGGTVVLYEFRPTDAWLGSVKMAQQTALTLTRQAQDRHSPMELAKAEAKAQKYGPRPWLLMRYELSNFAQRLAVNWAPVARGYRQG